MKFVKKSNEWAIVANGENSKTRQDGTMGATVVGPDGQEFCVYELNGQIMLKTPNEMREEHEKRNFNPEKN